MDKYQFTRDFFLVYVDQIFESSKTKSGLITSNTAIHNTNEEVEDRGEFKRRYGTVIEVPASFSENDVYIIDPLNPAPRRYVGHDWLQSMRTLGARGYREWEHPEKRYYPSTFEKYDVMTMEQFAKRVNVDVGDVVYFDHKSTDQERWRGRYKDGHLFAVQVNEILCTVKEEKIFEGYGKFKQKRYHPQGGWVFVELNMESWEDIKIPGTEIVVKCAPEALPLQGKVIWAQRKDLEGKNILFERDADAPITVDGRQLTCMEERDILATIKP